MIDLSQVWSKQELCGKRTYIRSIALSYDIAGDHTSVHIRRTNNPMDAMDTSRVKSYLNCIHETNQARAEFEADAIDATLQGMGFLLTNVSISIEALPNRCLLADYTNRKPARKAAKPIPKDVKHDLSEDQKSALSRMGINADNDE